MSRECPNPEACYNCGQTGHISRDCTAPPKPRQEVCYKCNTPGHIARDCQSVVDARQCRVCGHFGHISRDCNFGGMYPMYPASSVFSRGQGQRGRGGFRGRGFGFGGYTVSGPKRCYRCNAEGHLARDCPLAAQTPLTCDVAPADARAAIGTAVHDEVSH